MIDLDALQGSLIGIVASAVGSDLALMGKSKNLPAVIRDRQNGTLPDYPYIVVDHVSTDDTVGWLTNETVDDQDNVVYTTDKILNFRITCYGENGNQIMQKLKSRLRFDTYRLRLRDETGAAFVSESDVEQIPQLQAVEWIENGFMDLTISAIDSESDTSSTIIEKVGTEGTINDPEDNSITNISINVP